MRLGSGGQRSNSDELWILGPFLQLKVIKAGDRGGLGKMSKDVVVTPGWKAKEKRLRGVSLVSGTEIPKIEMHLISLDILIFIVMYFLLWRRSGRIQASGGDNSGELEWGLWDQIKRSKGKFWFYVIFYLIDYILILPKIKYALKYLFKLLDITLPIFQGFRGRISPRSKRHQCTNKKAVDGLSKSWPQGLWTSTSPLTTSILVKNGFAKNTGPNFLWVHFATLID